MHVIRVFLSSHGHNFGKYRYIADDSHWADTLWESEYDLWSENMSASNVDLADDYDRMVEANWCWWHNEQARLAQSAASTADHEAAAAEEREEHS